MSDAELWAAWRLWLSVAAVVVLLAAGLLIAIIVTARQILAEALRALKAAEAVRANTQVLWELKTTNEVAEQILQSVEAIEKNGGALVGTLQGQPVPRS